MSKIKKIAIISLLGLTLSLSACQPTEKPAEAKKDGITIKKLTEKDPGVQLAQAVAGNEELLVYEFSLPANNHSYQIVEDIYTEDKQESSVIMSEKTTDSSSKKGVFYYSLTAIPTTEDEPDLLGAELIMGLQEAAGTSMRKTGDFENSEFSVLGMPEVKVSKDGSYPLIGVKLINHEEISADTEAPLLTLSDDMVTNPQDYQKELVKGETLTVYRLSVSE